MNEKKHKIAESIEAITRLVNDYGYKLAPKQHQENLIYKKAHTALSYLFQTFICQICQGSGEVPDYAADKSFTLKECAACNGSGIQKDVLDRLEAEEITQGCGDESRQG